MTSNDVIAVMLGHLLWRFTNSVSIPPSEENAKVLGEMFLEDLAKRGLRVVDANELTEATTG